MHWLIDGHNLIGALPTLRLSDPHDEEKLLEYLRRYRARTGHKITVVFDAGHTYHPAETRKKGGLTVEFAAHGITADQVIMRRLQKIKNPQGTMVVSSDRRVQSAAQEVRVRVLSAHEFGRELLAQPESGGAAEAGAQTDVRLSADEVDEWLRIFRRSKPWP
jgi:predicted RNA-binding protein with PIN domain